MKDDQVGGDLEVGEDAYKGHYPRPHLPDWGVCSKCAGPLVQRNPLVLAAVGFPLTMFSAACLVGLVGRFSFLFFALAIAPGIYLLAWASEGKGLWCRECKRYPTAKGR